jgi:hypothetical protein
MSKKLLEPLSARSKVTRGPAKLGREILKKRGTALVIYNNKTWCVGSLLEALAIEVAELRKKQCKPSVKCLFEGQQYLDNKYLGQSDESPTAFY